jgi:hypothetical protein
MFGLKELSFDALTRTPWLVALACLILAALTALLYYRTNPIIEPWKRWSLATLRSLAIVALMLALAEPVLSFSREYLRPRRISVLLDRSASMDRTEGGKSRQARLDSLLSTEQFDQLRKDCELRVSYFGASVAESQDLVGREKTALGDAIASLATTQMTSPSDAWLLFSDGNSNAGRSPAEVSKNLTQPILSVNMAVDIGDFDFALEDVDYSPILFVGQPTDITVRLNWHNAAGKTARVQLLDNNRPVAENSLQITENGGKGEVVLRFTPTEPGQRLLKVTIPPVQGEENDGNNSRTVSLKVLKSKLMVLLVTARPDHEIGFLRRHLLRSDKYDVQLIATGPRSGNLAGQFPSAQTELNRYDLVVLHDPDPQMYTPYQQIIKSYLQDRGGALWVMLGEQYASRGPVPWFNELLPFSQDSRKRIEWFDFHGEPAENNLFHPSIRIADDRSGIRQAWNDLPPFKSLVRMDKTDPSGVVLAYMAESGRGDMRAPILGYKRFGPGKLLASAALPFWNWGFVQLGFGGNDSSYTRFIEGTTRWLTVRDDFDPVRVTPEKEVFTRGESVKFQGFAFDQGFRPIPGAVGTVKLTSAENNQTYDADLLEKGDGKYEATFDQLQPGKYSYVGSMSREGEELKRNEGTIVVENFSLEEFDQSGDPTTLQAVASAAGGKYYSFREFSNAISDLKKEPVAEQVHSEIPFWGKTWLLFLFIGLLSTEWIFRKMNQLL